MFRKYRRWIILGLWLVCLIIGSYTWKILHTGNFFHKKEGDTVSVEDLDLSVYVGDQLITRDDIEWEYRFYLEQLNTVEVSQHNESGKTLSDTKQEASPTSMPDKPIVELYDKIMGDLIERKLLYQFIGKDSRFTLDEPGRYTSCVQEWQKVVVQHAHFFREEKSREHLKAMLCEKDILQQYLNERILDGIRFEEQELREYYKKHKNEFSEPVRVQIRQIVLASEGEAKKVKARVTPQNFESMAREVSIAPEASQGGRLGPFAQGEMPSFFDIAFEMGPGEIQGTLKSTYGFHIIMLERRLPKVQLTFEAARVRIEQRLGKKRQEEEYKKWVEMALNSIPIRSSRGF
jgi:peptidyl-prolyl cis-trans isomerase C